MTGMLSPDMPLSRITVASLLDQGYEVDFSAADDFGESDLGICPPCDRRSQIATRQLHYLDHPDESSDSSQHRRLSADMRQYAIDYGRSK